jgi:hypothetical protein
MMREQFACFRKVCDVPRLEVWDYPNSELVYVFWGSGGSAEMNAALRAVWERNRQRCSKRTEFFIGDSDGHISYAPTDVGMSMFEIIRAYYRCALWRTYKVKLRQLKLRKIEKRLRAEGKLRRAAA